MKITKERLEEIRERASKATPGPWARDGQDSTKYQVVAHGNEVVCYHAYHSRQEGSRVVPNYEFIAHARTDVEALLDAVDSLSERLVFMEKALNQSIEETGISIAGETAISCAFDEYRFRSADAPELTQYLREKP